MCLANHWIDTKVVTLPIWNQTVRQLEGNKGVTTSLVSCIDAPSIWHCSLATDLLADAGCRLLKCHSSPNCRSEI
jgi:hypothetical protein